MLPCYVQKYSGGDQHDAHRHLRGHHDVPRAPLASRRHGSRRPTLKEHPEVHARQLPERLQPNHRRYQHRECDSQCEGPEPDHRFCRGSCPRKHRPDQVLAPNGEEEP